MAMAAPAKTSAEANSIPKMARIDSTRIAQTAIAATSTAPLGCSIAAYKSRIKPSRKPVEERQLKGDGTDTEGCRHTGIYQHFAAKYRDHPKGYCREREQNCSGGHAFPPPGRFPLLMPFLVQSLEPCHEALPQGLVHFEHGPALAAEAEEAPIEESPRQSKP